MLVIDTDGLIVGKIMSPSDIITSFTTTAGPF
jgi:hypothetical protein